MASPFPFLISLHYNSLDRCRQPYLQTYVLLWFNKNETQELRNELSLQDPQGLKLPLETSVPTAFTVQRKGG